MILKTLWASHMTKGAQIKKTDSEYVTTWSEALLLEAAEPFAKPHKDQRTRITLSHTEVHFRKLRL